MTFALAAAGDGESFEDLERENVVRFMWRFGKKTEACILALQLIDKIFLYSVERVLWVLGLTGYYRKFISNYCSQSALIMPLVNGVSLLCCGLRWK